MRNGSVTLCRILTSDRQKELCTDSPVTGSHPGNLCHAFGADDVTKRFSHIGAMNYPLSFSSNSTGPNIPMSSSAPIISGLFIDSMD